MTVNGVDIGILKDLPAYAVLIWLVINHEKRTNNKFDEISKLLGRAVTVIEVLEARLSVKDPNVAVTVNAGVPV